MNGQNFAVNHPEGPSEEAQEAEVRTQWSRHGGDDRRPP